MCERELSLARQEAEGGSRSGQALSAELHTLGRQNAALQQQLASAQAQLEETLDGRQAEVGLVLSGTAYQNRYTMAAASSFPTMLCCCLLANPQNCNRPILRS